MARGAQLRRRRRLAQSGAALGVLVLLVIATPLLTSGERDDRQVVAAAGSTTTTVDESDADEATGYSTPADGDDSSTAAEAVPRTGEPAPSRPANTAPGQGDGDMQQPRSPTTTGPPTTTTSAGACRKSHDPACGPFHYDPPPDANQPLVVGVTATPAAPRAGETVTFTVTVTDPDARIDRTCNNDVDYGDGNNPPARCVGHADCAGRFGAWPPPEKHPDRYETTFTHVYDSHGEYTARFTFQSFSQGGCSPDPYASRGTGETTVKVRSS